MSSTALLSLPEIARRLGISNEDTFDLMFRSRELPVRFEGSTHGVPESAVEAYRQAHPTH